MVQDLDQVLLRALPRACIPAQGVVSGVYEGFGLVETTTVSMPGCIMDPPVHR